MKKYQIVYEDKTYDRKDLLKELRRRANDWIADAYAHLGSAPPIRFRYCVIENDDALLVMPESKIVGAFEDNGVVETIVIDEAENVYTSEYGKGTEMKQELQFPEFKDVNLNDFAGFAGGRETERALRNAFANAIR